MNYSKQQRVLLLFSSISIIICLVLFVLLIFNYSYRREKYPLDEYNYEVVQRYDNKQLAAKRLRLMDSVYIKIFNFLKDNINSSFKKGIYKNLQKYKLGSIYETDPLWSLKYKASTDNMGRIGICLRKKNGSFYDESLLLFVFLHELAHVASTHKKYDAKNKEELDHPVEFWATFKVLLEIIEKIHDYKNIPYSHKKYIMYCDIKIEYNPYYAKELDKIIF